MRIDSASQGKDTQETSDLSRQVRENFAAKAAFAARIAPGMQVFESPHLLCVNCGLPSDTFNVVVARDLDGADLSELIRRNVEYFRTRHFPMAFWVWDSPQADHLARGLMEAGLESNETDVAMVAELQASTRVGALLEGFEIRQAVAAVDIERFGAILAGLFGDSPEGNAVGAYYARLAQAGLEPDSPIQLYLGSYQGKVISTGSLFLDGANAGIYDLATRKEYRRRGFGSALFRFLLQEAGRAGYSRSVLQASPDGLGIYRRAGFRAVGKVRVYENRGLFEEEGERISPRRARRSRRMGKNKSIDRP